MTQPSNQSEQNLNAKSASDASVSADAPVTGSTASAGAKDNLAFTNPDEYKHKHGEHKDGEHKHHHHHHHHHHHRHFHILNFSISGIRDNLKLLFKSIYAYPYIFLFLSLIFLFFMNSGLVFKLLNARKSSFASMETFYQWQEYLVMNKSLLTRIPFLLTLVVSVGILLYLMQQRERHWQRNVLKLLPALGAALIFSIPMSSARPAEDFARSACRDTLYDYYTLCTKFASRHNGAFPKRLPRNPSSAAAKYRSDHYIYHGAGKTANDEVFILIEDKKDNHVGDYRYAIRNDGVFLVSKYGGLYEEYKTISVQNQDEDEDYDDDFEWEEDLNLDSFLIKSESESITKVEGTIEERSILPDPAESDYPNCRFTAHFIGNTIISGQSCPKEVNLIIEGFADYVVLNNNNVKEGDRVVCTLIPFDKLPEDEQSTQQADDLELYLLDSYYAVDIKKINSFSDNGIIPLSGILFSDGNDDYISIFDRHINPPVSEKMQAAQKTAIQKDLEKMNELLNGYDEAKIAEINKSFVEVWKKEQEKDAPGRNRIGKSVWRNIDNSYWTLPMNYTLLQKREELSQSVLDCFSSLNGALEANGVQLIVSLVPDMDVISSRVINKQFRDIPDIETATYVKQLSEVGIETIYASDSIIRNYNKYPFAFFFPSNAHPSDTTQDVLSDLLAERLNRYGISRKLDSHLFAEIQVPHSYKEQEDYLFPKDCDIGNHKEGQSYTCRQILYNHANIVRAKDSPVIVIGNSYIETPVSPPDSLPALLSYKMCSGIDWYRISGFGPFSDIMIRLLTNPDKYLKGKKVLIMQVGTYHMRFINNHETMLDIAQLDNERTLLNEKKIKTTFTLSSNVNGNMVSDQKLWGPLSDVDKTVLRIGSKGEMEYSFDLEQRGRINDEKPILCFIPHMCIRNTSCKISINGQEKTMRAPNYAENSKFFNLAFELPAGTKEITIKITGKEDSLFAIKNIQIWQ